MRLIITLLGLFSLAVTSYAATRSVSGDLEERLVFKGTRSEHYHRVISHDGGYTMLYVLGGTFEGSEFDGLLGKHVTCTGELQPLTASTSKLVMRSASDCVEH